MPLRVILADDHLLVRQGLRLVLEKEQIEVLGEASDGLEAIRLIQELRPEIAVLDLDMPGLDGLAVLREAAKVPLKHAPSFLLVIWKNPTRSRHCALAREVMCSKHRQARIWWPQSGMYIAARCT